MKMRKKLTKVTHFNNIAKKSVQVIKKTRKKRTYEKYYDQDVQQEVIRLWIFSMYLCSKRLVPFIRDNIDYFAQKFGYDEQLKAKLTRISSATVGRIVKPEIPKHSIRGISTTRSSKNLNKLIPIRTFFDSCGGFNTPAFNIRVLNPTATSLREQHTLLFCGEVC